MTLNDPDTIERATRLRRIMNEFITTMTPQERDRVMQVHLAQARGPIGNGEALRLLTNAFIHARKTHPSAKPPRETHSSGDSR